MTENRTRPASPRWIGLLFMAIGVGALIGAFFLARKQLDILNAWPEVAAEVLNSEVTTHRDSDDNSTTYGVRIEFSFFLNGKAYAPVADRGFTTSVHSSMQRVADTFAPGTQHTIRYNPGNPADVRFNAAYSLEFFGVPVFVGAFGVIFLFVGGLVLRRKGSPYASASPPGQCPTCGTVSSTTEKFCPKCGTMLHEG